MHVLGVFVKEGEILKKVHEGKQIGGSESDRLRKERDSKVLQKTKLEFIGQKAARNQINQPLFCFLPSIFLLICRFISLQIQIKREIKREVKR